jgi:DNA-binding MurR/RpiR family transcriptional regulator
MDDGVPARGPAADRARRGGARCSRRSEQRHPVSLTLGDIAGSLCVVCIDVISRPLVALNRVGAKDALVAISLWRYLKDTIRLFELARTSRAKTVLIADSRLSPLAADAEITLTASTEAAELSHSLVSLVTLANVLATGVALSNPRRTVERLRTIDEFYDRFGVMSD